MAEVMAEPVEVVQAEFAAILLVVSVDGVEPSDTLRNYSYCIH
jgi:hypothetical protein